jgi:DNA-directed RNA polymerase subunit RPC12/RpoP
MNIEAIFKCRKCGKEHHIDIIIKNTNGIQCKLLSYTDVEFEFVCPCGEIMPCILK